MQIKWYELSDKNFDIYGISDTYDRLPLDFAQSISEGVTNMSRAVAGGRIRFCTNSKTVYIKAECEGNWNVGFDLYKLENGVEIFAGAFRNSDCFIKDGEFSAEVALYSTEMQAYTLNFPYVGTVKNFKLGILEDAELLKGEEYINEKPAVFYGSSITQGAWASRPGMTYESLLSQRFNLNYLNMGFAGAAKGEKAMIDYLASLDMCAFICDYDHNAYEDGLLEKTHLNIYKTVRKNHPDIPFIIVTRPDYWQAPFGNDKRTEVILKTYNYAKESGDGNVYFIDGKTFFNGEFYRNCTKDGCHPNDVGFYRMAEVMAPTVAKALKIDFNLHDYRKY